MKKNGQTKIQSAGMSDMETSEPVTRLIRKTREVALIDDHGRSYYRVDLDRCKTSADLLGWIHHLSQKLWIRKRHITELIQHAERENGVEINYGA